MDPSEPRPPLLIPNEACVRVTLDEQAADTWALVLASMGIAHRLEAGDIGWQLLVPAALGPLAARVLADYERENQPRPPPPRVVERASLAGLMIAAMLVGMYLVSGARSADSRWFVAGSADADAMLAGQWWRTVTALFLHADLAHVAANAFAGAVVLTAVFRRLGSGLGSWLVLATGALGNALTALAHGGHHSSVGASTAVFGAIGILGGISLATPASARRVRPAWVILAAVLALLGFLGAGERADVLAHLFGTLVGLPLGWLAGRRLREPLVLGWDIVLLALALGVVCAAWWIAMTAVV